MRRFRESALQKGEGQDRLILPVRENPFASRYVRPGALRFICPVESSIARIVDRLASFGWRGAIVGPHGSGKSTLLAHLAEELRSRGFDIHTPAAGASAAEGRSMQSAQRAILFVDGYDLLPAWKRWSIHRRCRRAQAGLVVTSHRPVGLPSLLTTSTSLELASELAALLAGAEFAAASAELIRDSFARHRGNLREVWFDLYDRYERTGRSASAELKA